jgi:hypothetical protein
MCQIRYRSIVVVSSKSDIVAKEVVGNFKIVDGTYSSPDSGRKEETGEISTDRNQSKPESLGIKKPPISNTSKPFSTKREDFSNSRSIGSRDKLSGLSSQSKDKPFAKKPTAVKVEAAGNGKKNSILTKNDSTGKKETLGSIFDSLGKNIQIKERTASDGKTPEGSTMYKTLDESKNSKKIKNDNTETKKPVVSASKKLEDDFQKKMKELFGEEKISSGRDSLPKKSLSKQGTNSQGSLSSRKRDNFGASSKDSQPKESKPTNQASSSDRQSENLKKVGESVSRPQTGQKPGTARQSMDLKKKGSLDNLGVNIFRTSESQKNDKKIGAGTTKPSSIPKKPFESIRAVTQASKPELKDIPKTSVTTSKTDFSVPKQSIDKTKAADSTRVPSTQRDSRTTQDLKSKISDIHKPLGKKNAKIEPIFGSKVSSVSNQPKPSTSKAEPLTQDSKASNRKNSGSKQSSRDDRSATGSQDKKGKTPKGSANVGFTKKTEDNKGAPKNFADQPKIDITYNEMDRSRQQPYMGINDVSKIPNNHNETFEKDEELSRLDKILKESFKEIDIPQGQNDGNFEFEESRAKSNKNDQNEKKLSQNAQFLPSSKDKIGTSASKKRFGLDIDKAKKGSMSGLKKSLDPIPSSRSESRNNTNNLPSDRAGQEDKESSKKSTQPTKSASKVQPSTSTLFGSQGFGSKAPKAGAKQQSSVSKTTKQSLGKADKPSQDLKSNEIMLFEDMSEVKNKDKSIASGSNDLQGHKLLSSSQSKPSEIQKFDTNSRGNSEKGSKPLITFKETRPRETSGSQSKVASNNSKPQSSSFGALKKTSLSNLFDTNRKPEGKNETNKDLNPANPTSKLGSSILKEKKPLFESKGSSLASKSQGQKNKISVTSSQNPSVSALKKPTLFPSTAKKAAPSINKSAQLSNGIPRTASSNSLSKKQPTVSSRVAKPQTTQSVSSLSQRPKVGRPQTNQVSKLNQRSQLTPSNSASARSSTQKLNNSLQNKLKPSLLSKKQPTVSSSGVKPPKAQSISSLLGSRTQLKPSEKKPQGRTSLLSGSSKPASLVSKSGSKPNLSLASSKKDQGLGSRFGSIVKAANPKPKSGMASARSQLSEGSKSKPSLAKVKNDLNKGRTQSASSLNLKGLTTKDPNMRQQTKPSSRGGLETSKLAKDKVSLQKRKDLKPDLLFKPNPKVSTRPAAKPKRTETNRTDQTQSSQSTTRKREAASKSTLFGKVGGKIAQANGGRDNKPTSTSSRNASESVQKPLNAKVKQRAGVNGLSQIGKFDKSASQVDIKKATKGKKDDIKAERDESRGLFKDQNEDRPQSTSQILDKTAYRSKLFADERKVSKGDQGKISSIRNNTSKSSLFQTSFDKKQLSSTLFSNRSSIADKSKPQNRDRVKKNNLKSKDSIREISLDDDSSAKGQVKVSNNMTNPIITDRSASKAKNSKGSQVKKQRSPKISKLDDFSKSASKKKEEVKGKKASSKQPQESASELAESSQDGEYSRRLKKTDIKAKNAKGKQPRDIDSKKNQALKSVSQSKGRLDPNANKGKREEAEKGTGRDGRGKGKDDDRSASQGQGAKKNSKEAKNRNEKSAGGNHFLIEVQKGGRIDSPDLKNPKARGRQTNTSNIRGESSGKEESSRPKNRLKGQKKDESLELVGPSRTKPQKGQVEPLKDKGSIAKPTSSRLGSQGKAVSRIEAKGLSDRKRGKTTGKDDKILEKSNYRRDSVESDYKNESEDEGKADSAEEMEEMNDSQMDYSSMKHRLKAFSHKQGVQPYQGFKSSVNASMDIKNALESFHYDGPLRDDSRERKSHFSTAKKSEINRFRTPDGRQVVDDYSIDQSLIHHVGPRSPYSGFKTDLINLSKSFGSANKKDHRLTEEDYSMLSAICTNPNEPVQFSAQYTGTIGGKTKPWARRHFPEHDQARLVTKN